jgi:hypothetical protein
VQFRIDFPAWLATLTAREGRMVREMAQNERTLDISNRFQVSPSWISQMRHEFRDGWERFCGRENQLAVAKPPSPLAAADCTSPPRSPPAPSFCPQGWPNSREPEPGRFP